MECLQLDWFFESAVQTAYIKKTYEILKLKNFVLSLKMMYRYKNIYRFKIILYLSISVRKANIHTNL